MVRLRKGSARKVLVAGSAFAPEWLRGVARFAREHDWHLVTDMLFTGALPRGWNGSDVLALLPRQPELLAHVRTLGVPVVACGQPETLPDVPAVGADDAEIGRIAAEHLLERAYRSFAWAPFLNDAANRARLAGFQARLAEHGCGCRCLSAAHTRIGAYWQEHWAEHHRTLVAELQRLPGPTAVFAFNDCVAIHVVDACRDAGLSVPEDIAVLGVGNSMLAESSAVPLSSVDDAMEDVGRRAATLLDQLITGGNAPPEMIRVPPRGVVTRVSTDVVAVNDRRVTSALSYIAEHYPNPMLTVSQVARAVGMSRRNLERSFRDETGGTINEYIIAIRMREASRLLKAHPRAKSTDIATLVGITGAGTFFRTFRRYFGVSPRAHRERTLPTSRPEPSPLGRLDLPVSASQPLNDAAMFAAATAGTAAGA